MDIAKERDGEENTTCKWQGIFERLQANIRRGVYSSKFPLPSEEAICRQYKVSRITVKRAMDELRARGLVYRKQGSGTFITKSANCESDFIAAKLRNTLLSKFKLRTPEDVMLAGFDDVRCASLMTPPLTTIHQPCDDLALLSYKSLRERMKNPDFPSRKILLPAHLVIRESTINPLQSDE